MIQLNQIHKQFDSFTLRIASLFIAIGLLISTSALERLDYIVYDKLLVLQNYEQETEIVIVEIDEESLAVLGQWPWSRSVHAELINRLKSIDNKVVALDLVFSELQSHDPFADELLAQAIHTHGNVILPIAPTLINSHGNLSLLAPHNLFRAHAKLGHTDIELDRDGIARRVFLYAGMDEPTWPTLGQVLAESTQKDNAFLYNTIHSTADQKWQHWERSHEVLIPYIAKPNGFQTISYADVLFNDNALSRLKNKVVIVGMTAAGLGTRFATPVSHLNHQAMTGVEWHANVFSMLKHNRAIHVVSKSSTVLISLLWITVILISISGFRRNLAVPISLVLFAFSVISLVLVYLILKLSHLWIPPGAVLLGILAIYPIWNWQRINIFLRSFFITKIRSSMALASIGDGVIITDSLDQVVYINHSAEKILQTDDHRIKGKKLTQILNLQHTKHLEPNNQAMNKILCHDLKKTGVVECNLKTESGITRSVRITLNQLYDEQRELIGAVVAMTDITDAIELTRRVTYQENYDALTKLPNRTKLLNHFDQMVQKTQNTDKIITVFCVALDHFKKINDAMGHHAGDKLLKMVTWRLFEIARIDNVIARWGGDEFILLFDNLDEVDSATNMAQKILDVIGQRFEIDNLEVFISASIGISFFPKDGSTSELVLEKAGTAMNQAKHHGGNRYDVYSPEVSMTWTLDRLELEKELRAAIENQELHVLFQPIVSAKTFAITRMEALVRWSHPTRGHLSPGEFIPLAENAGLIEQLGELVLRLACRSANSLLLSGYAIQVSVNVSPNQLSNIHFLDTIFKTLSDTGLPSNKLILEITESAIVNNMRHAVDMLRKINDLGILIALDDFGTGYSSLTLLRELPIDILKIDKSFVRTLDRNQNDLKIVQAIIGLGENLGLTIVAEGVETKTQSDILLQHHCHYQQGFYFSRPISYNALYELAHQKNIQINQSAL